MNTKLTYLAALLALIVGILLFTRNNDFPWYFHPDEPNKAEQVLEKWRNFHHPLLMLAVADRSIKIAEEAFDFERNLQSIAVFGRWVSAVFSAAGVAFLCLAAGKRGWWPAALLMGVLTLLNADLFRFAHYFKEDTALVFGWSLVLLSAALLDRKMSAGRLVLAGTALALAGSSKYVGILLLPLFLLFLWLRLKNPGTGVEPHGESEGERPSPTPIGAGKAYAVLLGTFLLVALLVNWRFFLEFQSFSQGFGRELAGVTEGHRGLRQEGQSRFTTFYLQLLWVGLPLVIWPMAAAYAICGVALRDRRRLLFDGLFWSSIVVYLVLISSTPKISDRYLLPVVVLLHLAAALGVAELLRAIWAANVRNQALRWGLTAGLLAMPGILAAQNLQRLTEIYSEFQVSSHEMLVEWLRTESQIPNDAVILQGRRVLPDEDIQFFKDMREPVEQEILDGKGIVEQGSLQAARDAGASYVLVPTMFYTRFLVYDLEKLEGDPQALDLFAKRARFYSEMVEQGQKIWERQTRLPAPLHPGLELWDIRPGSDSAPEGNPSKPPPRNEDLPASSDDGS
jgi:hypothetical protein